MMGDRRVDQGALFYEFCLERHVPQDHLLRAIDRFVDLEGVRAHLASFYSPIGRPSIDPELLIRMLLVGYCLGIRSERRLCEEVHLNLAYRWFCRLGLDGDVPDHSTFSKNRHGRFRESDLSAPAVRGDGGALHGRGAGRRGGLRHGREPDQGGRQQAAVGRRRRRRLGRHGGDPPLGQGVPRHARRRGLGRRQRGGAEVRLALGPRRPVDRRPQGPRLLRLRHELSDRPGPRRHRRRRGEPRDPPSRGRRRTHHDRAHPGPLRPVARAAGGRQRLWLGREPSLAGSRAGDRAAHPCHRQIPAAGRHVRTSRLRLRPHGRRLHLPRRQSAPAAAEDLRKAAGRRGRHGALSRQPVRLRALSPQASLLPQGARPITEAYVTSRRERKKVEMLFAHLKRILRLDRLRLRGPNGARANTGRWFSSGESTFAAPAQMA